MAAVCERFLCELRPVNRLHGRRRRRPLRHRDPLRCHCTADLPVEQHQEPRPHLHQPEADHLSDHPSLIDSQHQSPASRRGFLSLCSQSVSVVRAKRCRLPPAKVLRALIKEWVSFIHLKYILRPLNIWRKASAPIKCAVQYFGARGKVLFRATAESQSRALKGCSQSVSAVRAKRSRRPLIKILWVLI